MAPINEVSSRIIAALIEDPQATNRAIGKKVGLSEVTVASRIAALIDKKLIKIAVQRDISTLGLNVVGNIEIRVRGHDVEDLAHLIARLDGVISVSISVDDPQVVIVLASPDLRVFHSTVRNVIAKLPGVTEIETEILDVMFIRPGIAQL